MENRRSKIDFIIDVRKDISANTINLLTLNMSDEELDEFYKEVVSDTKDAALDSY
ncbi:hypothetical protein [Lactiplantibacillus mudanjiangensis]|uniref:Uncharacterized protein n=1 Tax=Lactiplantibacillus mudanjiangensis TaxID=1296538 RepID=A0A660E6D8_9LACO|nr:hypothetical protein [Lactiplantibacillus mudanjiangensis]VDG23703.1 hypothetical protein MUDAN_IGPPGNFN_02241 [Lactiplantibacillus mudanjiangensis]VDG27848.1 hypothetical protein MUDAN_MDHGFNIF_02670 [Lactiplantibacillus mudanjiangensis]